MSTQEMEDLVVEYVHYGILHSNENDSPTPQPMDDHSINFHQRCQTPKDD
jgi:hypothetical protein